MTDCLMIHNIVQNLEISRQVFGLFISGSLSVTTALLPMCTDTAMSYGTINRCRGFEKSKLIEAELRMYASVKYTIIGSDNGLWLV